PGAARQHHPNFFKKFPRRTADHRAFFRVVTVANGDFSVISFALTSGKGTIAAEKSQLGAALDPKHFRIAWIGIRPEEDYVCRVFRRSRSHIHRLADSPEILAADERG